MINAFIVLGGVTLLYYIVSIGFAWLAAPAKPIDRYSIAGARITSIFWPITLILIIVMFLGTLTLMPINKLLVRKIKRG